MPKPANSPYHHGDLRNALIDAGMQLTREGGPDALVLRDATRRVGVSPAAAYRHFADRDALLAAVAERIRQAMAERMGSLAAPGADGRATLRAVGRGYIAFALDEPGWFETLFTRTDTTPRTAGEPVAAPLAALSRALDTLVADGVLPADRRPGAEWPCWSMVHGFALLALHGPLRLMPESARLIAADRAVDTAIAGLLAA